MFKKFNPNPNGAYVGDCVIRALVKILNEDWHHAYLDVCIQGYALCDMPSANHVWGSFLQKKGFTRTIIPNSCPDCYTVRDFCADHPQGEYILATGSHVIAVVDGDYFDAWDSGEEVPIYYWQKGEQNGIE